MKDRYPNCKILGWNPWNFDAEPGDIMVNHDGKAYRLFSKHSGGKSSAGELSAYPLKKEGKKAVVRRDSFGKNILVWIKEKDFG